MLAIMNVQINNAPNEALFFCLIEDTYAIVYSFCSFYVGRRQEHWPHVFTSVRMCVDVEL